MDPRLLGCMYEKLDVRKKFLMAVTTGNVACIQELIRDGVDPNMAVQVHGENRPIHIAAHQGYHQCIDILIEAGADTNQPNDFGITPLEIHVRNDKLASNHLKATQSLLLGKASISKKTFQIPCHRDITKMLLCASTHKLTSILQIIPTRTSRYANNSINVPGFEFDLERHIIENLPNVVKQYTEESHKTNILKVYLMTGNKLSNAEVEFAKTKSENTDMLNYIMESHTKPPSLQHIARLVIRWTLKYNTFYSVTKLPLPAKLQEFLNFRDELDLVDLTNLII
ncbi:unnamed protein product [Owenia fusiformis]|uniref:SOCS box domain-containing protein n=1 Tax=Owenia fusiformis TaxID=6347 RepID=A0A8S4NMV4_OWEFU|nr:unnamed protein product [Owenia fusiformis]